MPVQQDIAAVDPTHQPRRRTRRRLALSALALGVGVWWFTAPVEVAPAGPDAADAGGAASWAGVADLPIVADHRYRMNGRIRPLLFWINRDRVGGGRITWRRTGHTVAFELTVGTDPDRAPRRLNRWGYLAERIDADQTELFGVMKRSSEGSLDEVTASLDREAGGAPVTFTALHSRVQAGVVRSSVSRLSTTDLTYRDLPHVLSLLTRPPEPAGTAEVDVGPSAEPGFLVAVARMTARAVGGAATPRRPAGEAIAYVYNGQLYDLALRRLATTTGRSLGLEADGAVTVIEFETRNRVSGTKSRFEIAYERQGDRAGVPLRIRYRPRWWLEAELVLDDSYRF
ncbi:MAG: hypothetical protein AB1635_05395 [Acidobacteriota bacterium]